MNVQTAIDQFVASHPIQIPLDHYLSLTPPIMLHPYPPAVGSRLHAPTGSNSNSVSPGRVVSAAAVLHANPVRLPVPAVNQYGAVTVDNRASGPGYTAVNAAVSAGFGSSPVGYDHKAPTAALAPDQRMAVVGFHYMTPKPAPAPVGSGDAHSVTPARYPAVSAAAAGGGGADDNVFAHNTARSFDTLESTDPDSVNAVTSQYNLRSYDHQPARIVRKSDTPLHTRAFGAATSVARKAGHVATGAVSTGYEKASQLYGGIVSRLYPSSATAAAGSSKPPPAPVT